MTDPENEEWFIKMLRKAAEEEERKKEGLTQEQRLEMRQLFELFLQGMVNLDDSNMVAAIDDRFTSCGWKRGEGANFTYTPDSDCTDSKKTRYTDVLGKRLVSGVTHLQTQQLQIISEDRDGKTYLAFSARSMAPGIIVILEHAGTESAKVVEVTFVPAMPGKSVIDRPRG